MPRPSTRPRALVLALVALLLLSGCKASLFWALNREQPAPDDIERVTYDPAHALALDVHRPQGAPATGAPVVVFFHGGSWRNGKREHYRFVGQALASHGVLAIVPDYRKAPEDPFPAFMDDAARAVAWAHAHARELGGDPSRLFVAGHSAGAHMAALLGTDARYLHAVGLSPRNLHGVVGLSGPYDFLPITHAKLREVFGDGPRWRDSQPVAFVDGDEPPFLLLHGGDDDLVMPANSEHLAEKLRARHEPVELRVVAGVSHFGMVRGFAEPERSPALAETLRFVGVDDDAAGNAAAPSP